MAPVTPDQPPERTPAGIGMIVARGRRAGSAVPEPVDHVVSTLEVDRIRARTHACTACGTTEQACSEVSFAGGGACCHHCELAEAHGLSLEDAMVLHRYWRMGNPRQPGVAG